MPAGDKDKPGIGRGERVVLAAAFAAAAAMAAAYLLYGQVDTDEPQLLHVAWETAQGEALYRDVFDNHMPVFTLAFAPVAGWVGERPDIIVWMRLANLPFFILCVWLSYVLSRRFFGRRTALWTAAILAVLPTFLNYGIQFRHEALWTACWLAAVLVIVGGEFGGKRAFAAGVLLGAAVAVSMKTGLMLGALGLAAVLLPIVSREAGGKYTFRRVARIGLALAAGGVILPAAVAVIFVWRGTLREMYYCVFEHNMVAGVGNWGSPMRWALCPAIVAGTVLLARRADKAGRRRGYDGRLTFLVLATGAYLSLLPVWPLVRPQTTLPVFALAAVLAVGLWLEWGHYGRRGDGADLGRRETPVWLRAGVFVLAAAAVLISHPPKKSNTGEWEEALSQVLALTDRADYVFDAKGETVFRRRPYYYCIETLTKARLKRGLTENDIIERCIETRTCAMGGLVGRFPADVREFMRENYLQAGMLYVAGRMIGEGQAAFEIAIPARYAVVTDGGAGRGMLDGTAYEGPRDLEAGRHEWVGEGTGGRTTVVWAQAVERGFVPEAVSR